MTIITIDTAKDDRKCCNSDFNDKELVTLRSCGNDTACATHIMPISRQMNFASHTTKQRANERKTTKIIVNNCEQDLCQNNNHTINGIKNNTTQNLLLPQRSNREYIRDKIFKNNTYCSTTDCNVGQDKGSKNLRTQHVRKRNADYFKDSAVSASTRIDRLKAQHSRKITGCCPSINSDKEEQCCSKNQPNPFLRFRR